MHSIFAKRRAAHREIVLGYNGALSLLLMELWSWNFPSMLKTRGRRASPSGVWLHPARPLGCNRYVTGGCKGGLCVHMLKVYAGQRRSHLLCNGLYNPPQERDRYAKQELHTPLLHWAQYPLQNSEYVPLEGFHSPATCQRQHGPINMRQLTFWVWKLHYVCCVNASPVRSEPSIYYCMMVICISCTLLFQVCS